VSRAVTDPRASVRRIARRHDENFPVVFRLLPADEREDMRAVYAYCRGVDDLGDEAHGDRLALLDDWQRDLERAFDGTPEDPRMAALAVAIRRRSLEPEPFLRLIEANRMDQRRSRWDTYEELLHYCEHSATPVGRLVLAVLGYRDARRIALSDATCIGLQLVNFWQDVRRDRDERDRIYLPREDMERYRVGEDDLHRPAASAPVRGLLAFEVARARALLEQGAPLARLVGWRARLDIRMFTAGGLALCDAIARQGYDTLRGRPAPGRIGRAQIAARELARTVWARPGRAPG